MSEPATGPGSGPGPGPVIERRRLADQAYEALRARILASQLSPGARLSVPRLAAELGLSRSPVREAVQRLVADGLGEEQVRRGAIVATTDVDELERIFEVRAALEGVAAGAAARLAGPDLLAELAEHLAEHGRAIDAGDPAAILDADLAFHARVMEAAGNPHLERALRPVLGRAQLAMLSGDLRRWPKRAIAEHRRILAAIRAHDPAAAVEHAVAHVGAVLDRHRQLH